MVALLAQLTARQQEPVATVVEDAVAEMRLMGQDMEKATRALEVMRHEAVSQRRLAHASLEKAQGLEERLRQVHPARWELSGLPHALDRAAWRDRHEKELRKENAELQHRVAAALKHTKKLEKERYKTVRQAKRQHRCAALARKQLSIVWPRLVREREARRTRLLVVAGIKRWGRLARAAKRRMRRRVVDQIEQRLQRETLRHALGGWRARERASRERRRTAAVLMDCLRRRREEAVAASRAVQKWHGSWMEERNRAERVCTARQGLVWKVYGQKGGTRCCLAAECPQVEGSDPSVAVGRGDDR